MVRVTGSEQLSRPFDVAEQDGLMEPRTTRHLKVILDLFLSWVYCWVIWAMTIAMTRHVLLRL